MTQWHFINYKISDNQYKYFEVLSRKEHEYEDEYIKEIIEDEINEQNELINKYNKICENSEMDNHNRVLKELKSLIKVYNE